MGNINNPFFHSNRVLGSCHVAFKYSLYIWVNTNSTHLLIWLRFFNFNTTYFIKQVNCVDPFIRFYIKAKKNIYINFSINQIDLNYEKPNKLIFFFNTKFITNK